MLTIAVLLNDFAERFLCYSTNLGVWCERSPVPSIPDVFEYAKVRAECLARARTNELGNAKKTHSCARAV